MVEFLFPELEPKDVKKLETVVREDTTVELKFNKRVSELRIDQYCDVCDKSAGETCPHKRAKYSR